MKKIGKKAVWTGVWTALVLAAVECAVTPGSRIAYACTCIWIVFSMLSKLSLEESDKIIGIQMQESRRLRNEVRRLRKKIAKESAEV